MRYRKLGNTARYVSEISFGTIPLLQGNVPVLPAYYNPDKDTAVAIMAYAFRLGCNLYDTAIVPEYGDAELKLGAFAAQMDRNQILISDKARFYDGNGMYHAVCTSCENLGTWADLYFVHQVDPSHQEEVFAKGGALDALTEQKQEGRIRFVGIASHYYDILLRGALDPRVDVLQGSGNLLERGMLDRIRQEPLFQEKGLLINKVYAAGLLPAFFPVQTLIGSVLSYPISSALLGIGTFSQAETAFTWACPSTASSQNLPDFYQVLSILEKEFSPIPCDRCQLCRCPYGIEIHTLFRQYHYFFLGKDHWALGKLSLNIDESAKLCRSCTQMPCLPLCPRKIRIPDEIQKILKLVRIHAHTTNPAEYHTV